MGKHILLVHDMTGYGKVALAALMPVLSHMGHHLYTLPTAIVSNTLDYGQFEIHEMTDYMRNTLKVWKNLGFSFEAVSTGMIFSDEQAELVSGLCRESAAKGVTVFVDPVMGDEGKLYNGVTEKTVEHMRAMASVADYLIPNYTEAAYLARAAIRDDLTRAEADALVDSLRDMGAKSVLITSAKVEGAYCVVGYDHQAGERFLLPFEMVPVFFSGTGDIFNGVMTGRVLDGDSLPMAVQKAMDAVRIMILRNKDNEDHYVGIPIETCLEVLD
ncbi:MAG: bifunctional hydroxymethylpyrimidine kinase/phosphomethylpyrimidine kinase [Clostridia bacterium]|nr:bifunctional hydroxymethylpyrimidine kinase/phosphomethylpyrimidine kinase [Clostridia bacterium]